MTEKILSITEDMWGDNIGWLIVTDLQDIRIGIDNHQQCCENFGYLITNDNADEFINSEILDITIVDREFNCKKPEELAPGSAMFVNVKTTKGVLQFVAYNEHNGYYGHDAVVISKQLNYSVVL